MKTNKIREVDWGIAYTSGQGNIYINKNLKLYDRTLYNLVLRHEKSHDTGAYNTHDLQEDMGIDFFPLIEKIKFCMRYPKGFLFLSPIIVTEDEIMISSFGLFKWGIVLAIAFFIIFGVF